VKEIAINAINWMRVSTDRSINSSLDRANNSGAKVIKIGMAMSPRRLLTNWGLAHYDPLIEPVNCPIVMKPINVNKRNPIPNVSLIDHKVAETITHITMRRRIIREVLFQNLTIKFSINNYLA
jgi:hypothetical protein